MQADLVSAAAELERSLLSHLGPDGRSASAVADDPLLQVPFESTMTGAVTLSLKKSPP